MKRQLYATDLLKELTKRVDASTQKQVAAELEVSPAFLCDVLWERRGITEELARKMGYRRVVVFEKAA